jgi:hypothetical protein
MSTLIAPKRNARYADGYVYVDIDGRVEMRFPVAANPRLALGTEAQLSRIEVSPYGLHWPELNEDLSFRGLLSGDLGQGSHS